MRRIIEQLKEQKKKAERTFIENSFIKRNCKIDAPCPDTDADLDRIAELNEAISILENHQSGIELDDQKCEIIDNAQATVILTSALKV